MKGLRGSISLVHAIATFWINSGVLGGMEKCILWWVIYLPKFLVFSPPCSQAVWGPTLAVIHYSLNISCEWCCMCGLSSGSPLECILNQSCVTDVSSLQARTLVPPRRPKSFVPANSAAGCARWGPLGGLELLAWLHSRSGTHLMCSTSFPAAAPSLARHTGKFPSSPLHLDESSRRTRCQRSLIPLRGKQEGRRELLVKCPLVSLQSQFPCCFRTDYAHGVWRDSQEHWLVFSGGISLPVLDKYNSGMKVSRELKIHFS